MALEIPYKRFRTGLTFKEVRQWFIVGGDECTKWRHVTRNTVLGKWHQHKLEAYRNYLQRIDAMMTIEKAEETVRSINQDRNEGFALLAGRREEALRLDALRAIADGCADDPRRLAAIALFRDVK